MSIRIMSQVWESGPEDRGELLVMLALADFADDRGRCWPSIATIAKRARMTTRSAQRILRKLQDDGAVKISTGSARHGCNEYVLTPDARVTPDTMSPLTPVSPPPDARVTPPLTPASPEPSLNHQEPSILSCALSAPDREPDRFQDFWDQYPHRNGAKKGKEAARKRWQAAIKARASPDQIIAGAMRYASDRQVIQGYAKDPATWLNQKGWEDDVETDHNRNGSGRSGSGNAMVDAFAAVAAERVARNRGG